MKAEVPLDIAKVKQRRLELKLSLADAARAAGLNSRQHWYKIENGDSDVKLSVLEAIARVLQVRVVDLLVAEDPQSPVRE